MLIHVDPHSGTPIYRQVIDQLSAMIMTGRLAAGEQVESVAALSKRIRVNPMTVSKAYSQLVHDGLLVRRPGIGIFVKDFNAAEREEARDSLLAEAMRKTAGLASQLGLTEKEAAGMFREFFRNAGNAAGDKTGNHTTSNIS